MIFDSFRLLILGTLIETGRRLCQWFMERFKFQLSVTARFDEGDPSYEWIILFLTQENVWRKSRDFQVTAKNSKRKWAVSGSDLGGSADYVPTYELAQLFRWRGYWIEVKRTTSGGRGPSSGQNSGGTIYLSIYTFRLRALSELVEDARDRYKEVSRPNVTVHIADAPTYGPTFVWSNVKQKARRPMSSIILPDGIVDSIIKDMQEFIDTEHWYVESGIPHRRGYLLYGPPGTGKTSTIYALAGELGLEIFSLSLSSSFIDDTFLQKAAGSMPKNSILLIEDIDCAFPSREEDDDEQTTNQFGMVNPMGTKRAKSAVTLSGLLNVLDGVGSEEGKLFFATTNYVDRLDPALVRPGRIDKKVEYFAATRGQASALYTRFFNRPGCVGPVSRSIDGTNDDKREQKLEPINLSLDELGKLAQKFASRIPERRFTTAELQGFLLLCKKQPFLAVNTVSDWVGSELAARKEKEGRDEERKRKLREKRADAMGLGLGLGGDHTAAMASRLAAMYSGAAGLGGSPLLSAAQLTGGCSPRTPGTPSPVYIGKHEDKPSENGDASSDDLLAVPVPSSAAPCAILVSNEDDDSAEED